MVNILGVIGIVMMLYFGKSFLLPVVVATFFWYLTKAIALYFRKVVRSGFLSYVLSGASILGVVYFFLAQIKPMLMDLYVKMPEITAGMERWLADLSDLIGTEITFAGMPGVNQILTEIGSAVAGVGAIILMILVYVIFIFIEQGTFDNKFRALFPDKKQSKKFSMIVKMIDSHMKKYLVVKTCLCFATAVFSYIGLLILGVDFAIVWAFFIFLLTYIPTIGSVMAGAMPTLYVFALTGEIQTPIMIAVWIAFVNLIFGNILEPKLTGRSLNLSALAILINMMFWGTLWGAIGMFFSVPIMVMIYVASAQFDKTRWISVLLSANGEIPGKNEE